MIWSPVNMNIYVVFHNGLFGYLNSNSNWVLNPLYTFSYGILRMSASGNYSFLTVSSNMVQSIYIFDIINNILFTSLPTGELNTVAHEWYGNDILYYMSPTYGQLYEYNITLGNIIQHFCFTNGT